MGMPKIPRYAGGGASLWSFESLPQGTQYENVPLMSEDGGESEGVLYTRGGEKTVVCFMHPRGDMRRHYAIPQLLEAGFACWAQAGRWVNNDTALIHEQIIMDVAEAMRFLKQGKQFDNVVLFGNSGGGALYSLYQSQAVTPVGQRLSDTAAGDPFDLNKFEMIPADAIIQCATHLGQGVLLEHGIDPSVSDEHDALSCDPALDMYNPDNGFKEFPESSKYSEDFLARYRQAQRDRVSRIDAVARQRIERQRYFFGKMGVEDFDALGVKEQQYVHRRAFGSSYMQVFRTEAHPAYADLSLYPSRRDIGSFFVLRPDLFNYMPPGFGKLVTPQAWLSTWSGHSSRAAVLQCSDKLTLPTLVVAFGGDNVVFSYMTDSIFEQSPAKDKAKLTFDGDHVGLPISKNPDYNGRAAAVEAVGKWVAERFGAR